MHAAAFPEVLDIPETSTGDLRLDVAHVVGTAAALFSDPVVRAALPGLLVELPTHPDLHQELMGEKWGTHRAHLQRQLDLAAEHGLVRPGIRAEHLLALIGGSVLLGVLTPSGQDLDEPWVSSITALILEGIVP